MRFATLIRYIALALLLQPLWSNVLAASSIVAQHNNTCTLTTAGGVQCWGFNGNGEVGDGTFSHNSPYGKVSPVGVSGLSGGIVALATGVFHSCAVSTAGGVQCWGSNEYGQLGDGTTTNRLTPVAVSGLSSGVVALAAGHSHTCALTSAGGVQCWGYNNTGELGDGTTTNRLIPVVVSGLSGGVQAIAAGDHETCAVMTAGVQCWGSNSAGGLGDGTITNVPPYGKLTPVAVSGLSDSVQAIAMGASHTCVLTTAGGVQCWGSNGHGQLGDGTNGDANFMRLTPVAVSGLSSGVQTIAAGDAHTCAGTAAGGAQCWGENLSGQLGDGTTTDRLIPVVVSGLSGGVQTLAAGGQHSCALMTMADGVMCWGRNSNGQLGDGTIMQRLTPVYVVGFQDSDSDSVLDRDDPWPLDPTESVDTDHDGIGNNADTDDDGDGLPDAIDANPLVAQVLNVNGSYRGSTITEDQSAQ